MNKDLAQKAIRILDSKKAIDIEAIEIKELTILADCFIIATGTSNTHIKALAEELESKLEEEGILPRGIEGRATGWILLDYESVVVHLFLPDAREHYNLSRLWVDATRLNIQEIISQ